MRIMIFVLLVILFNYNYNNSVVANNSDERYINSKIIVTKWTDYNTQYDYLIFHSTTQRPPFVINLTKEKLEVTLLRRKLK